MQLAKCPRGVQSAGKGHFAKPILGKRLARLPAVGALPVSPQPVQPLPYKSFQQTFRPSPGQQSSVTHGNVNPLHRPAVTPIPQQTSAKKVGAPVPLVVRPPANAPAVAPSKPTKPPVDDSPLPLVPVKFVLKYKTSYGQIVRLIGSHPTLGNWTLAKAVELHWTDGDNWVANVKLPPGVYEYKYVLVDYDSRQALAWQQGSNAVLAVDVSESDVEVSDNWGNNPGAETRADSQRMTREHKLAKWAGNMIGHYREARAARAELEKRTDENGALRAEVARLRMELSLAQQARLELEGRVMSLEQECVSLKATVSAQQVAMRNTLEEAIRLLSQEIDEEQEGQAQVGQQPHLQVEEVEDGEDDDEVEDEEEVEAGVPAAAAAAQELEDEAVAVAVAEAVAQAGVEQEVGEEEAAGPLGAQLPIASVLAVAEEEAISNDKSSSRNGRGATAATPATASSASSSHGNDSVGLNGNGRNGSSSNGWASSTGRTTSEGGSNGSSSSRSPWGGSSPQQEQHATASAAPATAAATSASTPAATQEQPWWSMAGMSTAGSSSGSGGRHSIARQTAATAASAARTGQAAPLPLPLVSAPPAPELSASPAVQPPLHGGQALGKAKGGRSGSPSRHLG